MALSGKLRRGTWFGLAMSSDTYSLGTTSATVVAHGPPGEDGTVPTKVWRWRPATQASDPEFRWDATAGKLIFTLTSQWTASVVDGFSLGSWKLYLLVGNPFTNQDDLAEYTLTVTDGRGGPMPVFP